MKTLVLNIKELLNKKRKNDLGNLHYKLEGRFTFVLTKPDGTSRTVADFPNLITNGGLDRIGSGNGFLNYIHLGTGSTTPTFTDTALTTFLASSTDAAPTLNDVSTCANSSPYYAQYTINKRFAAGIATGNLTEVGVSWSASTGSLFSHALILDDGGNPTTITKLADEVLDVLYTLRVYAPLVDVSATVNGYSTVIRASSVTYTQNWSASVFSLSGGRAFSTQTLGSITQQPGGAFYGAQSIYFSAYVNGSYSRKVTLDFGLTHGNVPGGIGSLTLHAGFGDYQCSFTPVIPKDSTKVLTFTFIISFGRV